MVQIDLLGFINNEKWGIFSLQSPVLIKLLTMDKRIHWITTQISTLKCKKSLAHSRLMYGMHRLDNLLKINPIIK